MPRCIFSLALLSSKSQLFESISVEVSVKRKNREVRRYEQLVLRSHQLVYGIAGNLVVPGSGRTAQDIRRK